jgi:hypothetical protein
MLMLFLMEYILSLVVANMQHSQHINFVVLQAEIPLK